MDKNAILEEFQTLPGVGKSIAEDLWLMGFRSNEQLKDKDPDVLYAKLNALVGHKTDPCMLYVFRCIVYAVTEPDPIPRLLKWWNWSDKKMSQHS